jgi:Ala-tRNA(Pro) deacylase
MEEGVMSVAASVQEFLRRANVSYSVLTHLPAYTAQEEAASTHVPGRDWAKTVICFADGEPIEAVVAANQRVNLEWLAAVAGAREIRLAGEDELDWLYPDCEPGAVPPLGPLFRQAVFVDVALAREERIAFNAGTHTDAVVMKYRDFAAIAQPIVGRFAQQPS